WLFYFWGIKLGGAAIGALGFSTYGVQLALLGRILKLNELRPGHVAALTLALTGSALIMVEPGSSEHATLGLLSGIVSGTFYAALPVLHQRHRSIPNDIRALGQFSFALLI